MPRFIVFASIAIAAMLALAPALADEWQVMKLRGSVQQQVNGQWVDLKRGDMVADDNSVRTLEDGHVDLQRGQEVVSLGASTQVRIHDKTDARYTTVDEDFGSVEVEAEAKNFEHFSVETAFLAAVVKGTHFTVDASAAGASVSVSRGAVAVQSKISQRSTTVTIGQIASIAPNSDIVLSGTGPLPPIFGDGGPVVPESGPGAPSGAQGDLRGPLSTAPAGLTSASQGSETQTAVVLTPLAAPNVRGQVDRALGTTGLSDALLQTVGTAPIKEPPLNFAVIWIGVLIGAAVGALALLWRRYL